MTITKKQNTNRKRKADETAPVPATKIMNIMEDFQFSKPSIVSKERFKTDHFYYYVFCDPEYLENVDVDSKSDLGVIDTLGTKDINLSYDTVSSDEENKLAEKNTNLDLNFEGIADVVMANFLSAMFGAVRQETIMEDKGFVTEIAEADPDSQNQIFPFRKFNNDPQYINTTAFRYKFSKTRFEDSAECSKSLLSTVIKTKSKIPKLLQNIFSVPRHESFGEHSQSFIPAVMEMPGKKPNKIPANIFSNILFENVNKAHEFDLKKSANVTNVNITLTKNFGRKSIVDDDLMISFRHRSSQDKINNSYENVKCQFCCIFNVTGFCGHCKTPVQDVHKDYTIVKDASAVKVQNYDKNEETKTWQCKVCLITNNTDRLTCQCCGNMNLTELSGVKIKFGNNQTFQIKEIKSENNLFSKESDDTIQPLSSELNETIPPKELPVMDSSENDKLLETVQMISMETDTATFKEFPYNTEAMDVEESPTTSTEPLYFNNQLLNFNVQTVMNSMLTDPDSTPNIGTSLQFNIGTGSHNKSLNKLKKAMRNTSKAKHK